MRWVWLGWLVLAVVSYELVRAFVVRAALRWYAGRVRKTIREQGVRLDAFKFGNKQLIKEELENDLRLNAYLVERARDSGEAIEDLRARVETYIEEIVPAFNLLSY